MRGDLAHHFGHDFVIRLQQIVAAHARLAWNAGGDHHDVRISGVGVVIRTGDLAVALFNGHSLEQVESLALRDSLDDVDQHHIREFLRRDPVGGCRPNISRSYDRYLFPHTSPSRNLLCTAGALDRRAVLTCSRSCVWRTRWSLPWLRPASG